MTLDIFYQVIEKTLAQLEKDAHNRPERYTKSGEDFEPCVVDALREALYELDIIAQINYTPGGHGFPDIVIESDGLKYGIEVKSTTGSGNTWKINGNSVMGSTREPDIQENMIIFGKMRKEKSIFRAKKYEQCVSNVVVTHSPRYLIDLDITDGENFFEKSNITYDSLYNAQSPINRITDYFLSIGQKAWWLAKSTPAAIRMFGDLEKSEQQRLLGYAFAHYPEIFSHSRTKFYRFMSWMASEESVIDPSLRDRFTAGGKVDIAASGCMYKRIPQIFKNLYKYRNALLHELAIADKEVLEKDWETAVSIEYTERVGTWIKLVCIQIDNEDVPHINKQKLIENIIFEK